MPFPTGATRPTIATAPNGTIIRAAVVTDNSGNSTIYGMIQNAGDISPSAPMQFVDSSGTPLAVLQDTFHLQPAYEGPFRWLLVVGIVGDSAPSEWESADDGGVGGQTQITWKRSVHQ